jgi:SAM-dependent methyltransferase
MNELAEFCRRAHRAGWSIDLMFQDTNDKRFSEYLGNLPTTEQFPFRVMKFGQSDRGARAINYYRNNVTVAASMRGHGIMIPFGLHVATISMLTHSKVKAFVEDIGHPEWGVEMTPSYRPGGTAHGIANELETVLTHIDANRRTVHAQIRAAQQRLMAVTARNMRIYAERAILHPPAASDDAAPSGRSMQRKLASPSKRSTTRAPDGVYEVYNSLDRERKYHNPNFSLEASLVPHITHFFEQQKVQLSTVRIVSLGCSLGHGVAKLAALGYDAYGVDVSNESVAQAIGLGRGSSCTTAGARPPCLQQASLTALPFESCWFHAGLSADVLEHVHPDDVAAAVAEISRTVRSILFLRISTVPEGRKLTLNGTVLNLHLTVQPHAWWLGQFSQHGWVESTLPGFKHDSKTAAFLALRRDADSQASRCSAVPQARSI